MSMTDEKIIEALECCVSGTGCDTCRRCPFYEDKLCDKDRFALEKHLLDLIKRQQEEIEKLNKVKVFNFTVSNTKEIMPILFCHEKELKNQAVKEFAKFLIDKAENNVIRIGDLCEYVIDFNEMTEKEGGKG